MREFIIGIPAMVKKYPLLATAIVSFVLFSAFTHLLPAEEPLSLFDGVSVWPTEMLRCLAVGFSIYFIWKAKEAIKINSERTANKFCLTEINKNNMPSSPWVTWKDGAVEDWQKKPWRISTMFSIFRGYWKNLRWKWEPHGNNNMAMLWKYYMERDSETARHMRI